MNLLQMQAARQHVAFAMEGFACCKLLRKLAVAVCQDGLRKPIQHIAPPFPPISAHFCAYPFRPFLRDPARRSKALFILARFCRTAITPWAGFELPYMHDTNARATVAGNAA
ncbi:MAG TPA: hypothetical protein VNE00_06795 [Paraburkholderia sp.]|nr:hypothetical protein [Paraburkholderia sp.]